MKHPDCCLPKFLMRLSLVVFVFQLFATGIRAQDSTVRKETDELRLKLNPDGTHFLKLTVLGQLWVRYNQSNPGTTVLKDPAAQTFDIGIRRLRFSFFGQITDHAFFFIHIGGDNFNYLSARKFTPFIQDMLGEYRFRKGSEALIFGLGLGATSGLSRFTQPQLSNIVSMDVPVFALPTFDLTDQYGRKLSLYARGQIGKLDYRLIASDPFPIVSSAGVQLSASPVSPDATYAQEGNHYQYQGLFMWNFFDREPHVLSYMPGTYYGKKKVLNLEAGFIVQKNATWSSPDSGHTVNYHALRCWSVGAYYDAPLNRETGTAIDAYLGYFNYDFGPGYLRYIGVMNPADGLGPGKYFPGSQGNAMPVDGTGKVIYAQASYLFPKEIFGNGAGTPMPFVVFQHSNYERLDKAMTVFDIGVNWLLHGITNKLTLDYQNRPVYTVAGNNLIRSATRKGQLTLQYQFFL